MKAICFDMDGTIADLYNVPDWLEKLRSENPEPYIVAKPMWDMERLGSVLRKLQKQGWQVRIISWLAKDSSENYKEAVRAAKRWWLEHYDFPLDGCHLVEYGTTKANCVRKYWDEAPMILIDDNEKVRHGWNLGEAINPQEVDIIQYLENLAERD